MNFLPNGYTFDMRTRFNEIVRSLQSKVRYNNDYYSRMLHAWTGACDYTPADEGEEKEIKYPKE